MKSFSPSLMLGHDSVISKMLAAEIEFDILQQYKFKAYCNKYNIPREDIVNFSVSLNNFDDNLTGRSMLLVALVAILFLAWKTAQFIFEGEPILYVIVWSFLQIIIFFQIVERISYNERAKSAAQLSRTVRMYLDENSANDLVREETWSPKTN